MYHQNIFIDKFCCDCIIMIFIETQPASLKVISENEPAGVSLRMVFSANQQISDINQ
jgi:hypothetical protein